MHRLLFLAAASLKVLAALPLPVPFIDTVSPPSATVGSGPLSLRITGGNFAATQGTVVVNFNGTILPSDTVTVSEITVTVPYTMLTVAGTRQITVTYPGSHASNPVSFPVTYSSLSFSHTQSDYRQPEPTALVSADFNGDGKPDLAIANVVSNSVNILLGDGSGNFTPGNQYPAGQLANGIATGDLNNDGNADLVAVSYSDGSITILLGDGTGNFTSSTINTGVMPPGLTGVAIGDFNADGNPDLLVGGYFQSPLLFFGDGTGHFTAGPSVPTNSGAGVIKLGDFNGDGQLDALIGGFYSTNVTVLLGDGAGSFQASAIPLGGYAMTRAIATGDFDGDGNTDFALVTSSSTNLSIYLGDGRGHFTLSSTPDADSPLGGGPIALVAGDFNGDQKPDLAVVSGQSADLNILNILSGDGNGNFNESGYSILFGGLPGNTASAMIAADFNGDGQLDLAITDADSADVSILRRNPAQQIRTLYSVTDLCLPLTCGAKVLGNSGAVAGVDFAVYPGTGYTDFLQMGLTFLPADINREGVIVGTVEPQPGQYFAAAWVPQTSEMLYLSPENSPAGANHINDYGDITGAPYCPGQNTCPITSLVPTTPLISAYGVFNNQTVLGVPESSPNSLTLFSPGLGSKTVPITPFLVNTAGQVSLGTMVGQYLTAGGGQNTALPVAPNFLPTSFNTTGAFVGYTSSGPGQAGALYTASGGVVPLSGLVDPASGWTLVNDTNYRLQINDSGQILARGTNQGRTSSVLLTPFPTAASPMNAPAISPARIVERRAGCRALTFNMRQVCSEAVKLPVR